MSYFFISTRHDRFQNLIDTYVAGNNRSGFSSGIRAQSVKCYVFSWNVWDMLRIGLEELLQSCDYFSNEWTLGI
jgi:hypothetical protein